MQKVIFHHPGKLVFGEHAMAEFVQDCLAQKITRLYVLTIKPLESLLSSQLAELLKEGVLVEYDFSVTAEPSFQEFEIILAKARAFSADGVVGVGGGSVMDVAKLVAAQIQNSQTTSEIIGNRLLKERKTWLACLPSTSGTGSEVSPNAIFLDETDGGKKGVISPFLVPDGAYIDPILTAGVPKDITAATGIDALTHCLEAYINKFSHPMVDLFALEGIRLIAENLKQACDKGNDLDARAKVALGSVYGGMCLGPVNTAAVHALAYPLGSMFKIPHGLSNALMLPAIIRFSMSANYERYAAVAVALGASPKGTLKEVALAGVDILEKLMIDCGIPSGLAAVGISENAIEKMGEEALKIDRLLKNNPRELSLADIITIYKESY